MNSSNKKILLSGIQPSGTLHIGNYFGAIKQFVELQKDYDTRIFIADLHAINSTQDALQLSKNIFDIAVDYLALGLDPENIILFKQSDVPDVAELCWYFNCITTVPYLERAHAYKDKVANGKEANVGLFDYPILMAADILVQDAQVVPVGADQRQHVEFARDIAEKFNRIYGETFILPEAMILDNVATVPGIDGRKMSKSYNNTIPLFVERDEIKALVMRIATDSKTPDEVKNPDEMVLYQIHKLFNQSEELKQAYTQGMSYKEAKERLIDDIDAFIEPFRKRRDEIASRREYVLEVLREGAEKARPIIKKKMDLIRKRVGVHLE